MLTPAFPADLPPLGKLVADDPFWRYPPAAMPGEDVAHLRVWLTTGPEPGHLAVVTGTGPATSVTQSAGQIWSRRQVGALARPPGHSPAPGAGVSPPGRPAGAGPAGARRPGPARYYSPGL